jgi:hypothetical protein
MTLTEERPQVTTTHQEPGSPLVTDRKVRWGWVLVGLAVVAAVVVAVLAFRADDGTVDPGSGHDGLVENGSITAIDHAAESATSARATSGHDGLVENGSITAIDHAAESATSARATSDNDGLVENGSITAIDHAAESATPADLDVAAQLRDWARTNGLVGLSPASATEPD